MTWGTHYGTGWIAGLVLAWMLGTASAQTAPPQYESITLDAPGPEQTVHDNAGIVRIAIAVAPELATAAGHRLRISLDGRVLEGAWESPSITLEGIDRGEHTLQAFVVDTDGKRLLASAPVKFYVWRASRRFHNRR